MLETAEQYRKRLAAYIEGKDPLTIQHDTPRKLARLRDGLSVQQVGHRPSPDKWSIIEILAHLANDELATSWRHRQMIEHDGGTLQGLDQELWARAGSYSTWNAEEALSYFGC